MPEDDKPSIDDETITEKFERVHDHLNIVDKTLDEISKEIKKIIDSELADIPININYNIDEGLIQAQIPVDGVAARVNRRLEPPFFVEVEGNSLIVNDIRNIYDGEIELNGIVDQKQKMSAKRTIHSLEDVHSDGAPKEHVVKLLVYAGLSRMQAELEIDKLKQKGEVYEPSTEKLKTT